MKRTFLMTVAAAALIAGAGLASAQDKQQMPRIGGTAAQGAASSETKIDAKPSTAAQDKPMDRSRNAQDNKSKAMEKSAQTPDSKAKADGKISTDTKAKADGKMSTDTKASTTTKSSTDTKASSDVKSSSETSQRSTTGQGSSTTGQGAAAASVSVNLAPEQRTKIVSVLKQQKVQPVTNVNFSISIGTKVPRTVRYYPLPREVVEIYPVWRGYDFILVGDQIIVINPRTLEIVAVLEA